MMKSIYFSMTQPWILFIMFVFFFFIAVIRNRFFNVNRINYLSVAVVRYGPERILIKMFFTNHVRILNKQISVSLNNEKFLVMNY